MHGLVHGVRGSRPVSARPTSKSRNLRSSRPPYTLPSGPQGHGKMARGTCGSTETSVLFLLGTLTVEGLSLPGTRTSWVCKSRGGSVSNVCLRLQTSFLDVGAVQNAQAFRCDCVPLRACSKCMTSSWSFLLAGRLVHPWRIFCKGTRKWAILLSLVRGWKRRAPLERRYILFDCFT